MDKEPILELTPEIEQEDLTEEDLKELGAIAVMLSDAIVAANDLFDGADLRKPYMSYDTCVEHLGKIVSSPKN